MQQRAFDYIRQMVKREAGIVVEPGKEYLAKSRLSGLAREHGFAAIEDLVHRLRTQPFGETHRRVVELLATNETRFFRDHRPFDCLRATILPQLFAARPERRITIWCAAASSGQEPYSVAMLLLDQFPRAAPNCRIIASDLSRDMLARTARGVYSQFEIGRGLSSSYLERYFVPLGASWQVKAEVRAMVETKEINLAVPLPALPPIDLLLLRNVLIYFDLPTKQDILVRVHKTLSCDGVLMLGGTETALGTDAGFERCTADDKATWYRQRPTGRR